MRAAPDLPRPDPACPACGGQGAVPVEEGPDARLAPCTCLGSCLRCGGTGRRPVTIDGVDRLARCRCQELPDRIAAFNHARIPRRYAHCRFETFRVSVSALAQAHRQVHRWVRDYHPDRTRTGLCLWGPAGRGKTHLLVAALRVLAFERGVQVRFVEFSHLLGELREGFSRGLGQSERLAPLFEVPVLAIDELGKGRNTEWERTIVDELVSRRYNAMLPILATTNYAPRGGAARSAPTNLALARPEDRDLSVGELVGRVGERVYSRLTEMVAFVHLEGPDFRASRPPG